MAKLKPNEKRVQLSFQRPEDVALFERLEKMAYDRRYDMPTFLLLALQEAFPLPDKDEEDRQALLAHLNSPHFAKDMDHDLSHHMKIDASERRGVPYSSGPLESAVLFAPGASERPPRDTESSG